MKDEVKVGDRRGVGRVSRHGGVVVSIVSGKGIFVSHPAMSGDMAYKAAILNPIALLA